MPDSDGLRYTVLTIQDQDVVQMTAWLPTVDPLKEFVARSDELRAALPEDIMIVSAHPERTVCGHTIRYLLRHKAVERWFLENVLLRPGLLTPVEL